MSKILTSFNNFINININNKKSEFNLKKNFLNKKTKNKLTKLKKLNMLSLKKVNNNIKIKLKFYENKPTCKNVFKL
jgi:hypothetical protein